MSFLKLSAIVKDLFCISSLEIFVTPSTNPAISSPKRLLTSSKVVSVSSIVSCNNAVVMVGPSSFNSAKIFATAIGRLMWRSPEYLFVLYVHYEQIYKLF